MITVFGIKNSMLSSVLGSTKHVILTVKLCPVVSAVSGPPVSICPFEPEAFLRPPKKAQPVLFRTGLKCREPIFPRCSQLVLTAVGGWQRHAQAPGFLGRTTP